MVTCENRDGFSVVKVPEGIHVKNQQQRKREKQQQRKHLPLFGEGEAPGAAARPPCPPLALLGCRQACRQRRWTAGKVWSFLSLRNCSKEFFPSLREDPVLLAFSHRAQVCCQPGKLGGFVADTLVESDAYVHEAPVSCLHIEPFISHCD